MMVISPSAGANGLAGLGSSDDYDDVPEPKDCHDDDTEDDFDEGMISSDNDDENAAEEDEDDALLRDKHETDMSDDAIPAAPPAPLRLI